MIARRDASEQGRQKHRVPLLGLIISGIFAILVCDAVAIGAEESNAQRVDRLKAGYLLNFVRFVDWPASGSANVLTVCFVGGQTVLDALASGIENKTAGERHLAARMLSESEPSLGCNVLYLEASTMRDGAHALNLGDMPILTVSDAKDFARSGGMIELFTDANHIRFNINVGSAQKAGLHISSSLLQLAATVEQATPK